MTDQRPDLTSIHVRRAIGGDRDSTGWIIENFSPLLHAQATYRLQKYLPGVCEPDDLVQEVWTSVLPKLGFVEQRGGRFTPVLVSFLSQTLLHHYNNLLRKHKRRRDSRAAEPGPREAAAPATELMRREACTAVRDAIQRLSANDREVLILRAIEQRPNREVAELLGVSENVVSTRLRRALARLRKAVPTSVVAEL